MADQNNGSNGNGQAMTRSNASPIMALQSFLKTREKTLAQWVAGRLKPDTLIRLALLEFSQQEWLRKCSPESIYSALITSAQLGLEPSGVKGEAYLVPFKGKCTLIPGYRGLIKLALRSKGVKSIYSHLVYAADDFSIELGSEPRVVHRPSLNDDRGDLLGCYAVAHLDNGQIDVEWASIVQLEKVRAASPSGNSGPYKEWAEEMYRKTPLRRLCKRLPLGDDFFQATAIDEANEAGKDPPRFDISSDGGDIIDADVEEKAGASSLRDKVRERAHEAP